MNVRATEKSGIMKQLKDRQGELGTDMVIRDDKTAGVSGKDVVVRAH